MDAVSWAFVTTCDGFVVRKELIMGLETLSRSGLRLLQPMLQDDVQNRVLDISLSSSELGYDKLTDIGAITQCCVLFTTVDRPKLYCIEDCACQSQTVGRHSHQCKAALV